MKGIGVLPLFSALSVVLLLGACAGQETRQEQDNIGDLGRSTQESPADIYLQMGIAYLQDGQLAIALKKLKKGLVIDTDNAEIHNVIAILYERLGEMQLAETHYGTAVKLQPKNPYIHNARGSFFCKQKRYQEAKDEFERAVSNPLYPTPWVALANAGLCAERADDKTLAESYYRRALSSKKDYPLALYQMAEASLDQGNYLPARGYLERYNSVAQPTAGSLWLGVRIEHALGGREQAAAYKKLLRDKFPDAPEVQLLNKIER